ncbi:MAG: hypothetical protein LBD87_00425 [Prevotellaceae bacterium]|nr:hypothetical protein [Prevotellaceae bacterium]
MTPQKPVKAKKVLKPAAKKVAAAKKPVKKVTVVPKTPPAKKVLKPVVKKETKKQVTPIKPVKPALKETVKNTLPPRLQFPQRIVTPSNGKRRLVVNHKNLSPELQEVMRERFPRGYSDYMDKIMKVDKADGSFFYAITLEVEDAVYLIKIDVQVDTDYEEVEKKLFGTVPEVDDDGNEIPDSDEDNEENLNEVAGEE